MNMTSQPQLRNAHAAAPSPTLVRKADLLTSVSHDAHSDFNPHDHELHNNSAYQEKLNRLRASVLGANDGIVSVAATVVGVAGVTASTPAIAIAATAAVVGGALALAVTYGIGLLLGVSVA